MSPKPLQPLQCFPAYLSLTESASALGHTKTVVSWAPGLHQKFHSPATHRIREVGEKRNEQLPMGWASMGYQKLSESLVNTGLLLPKLVARIRLWFCHFYVWGSEERPFQQFAWETFFAHCLAMTMTQINAPKSKAVYNLLWCCTEHWGGCFELPKQHTIHSDSCCRCSYSRTLWNCLYIKYLHNCGRNGIDQKGLCIQTVKYYEILIGRVLSFEPFNGDLSCSGGRRIHKTIKGRMHTLKCKGHT